MDHPIREDTLRLSFDPNYARPKPYEIEEFLDRVVQITVDEIIGIHLSIVSSTVYLKLITSEKCKQVIERCGGILRFKHSDGNIGEVRISQTGMGLKTLRIFELPFEITAEQINSVLQDYGTVVSNVAEKWSTLQKFPVLNGVRQVKIDMIKHIPSYITVCGYRAIVIYDGQPRTCAACGSTTHVRAQCIQRRVTQIPAGEKERPRSMSTLPRTYAAAIRSDAAPEPSLETTAPGYGEMQTEVTHMEVNTTIEPSTSISPEIDTNVNECHDKHEDEDVTDSRAEDATSREHHNATPEKNDAETSPKKRHKKRRIAHDGAKQVAQTLRDKAKEIGHKLTELTPESPPDNQTVSKKTRTEDVGGENHKQILKEDTTDHSRGTGITVKDVNETRLDTKELQPAKDWADDEGVSDIEMADARESTKRRTSETGSETSDPTTTVTTGANAAIDDPEFF